MPASGEAETRRLAVQGLSGQLNETLPQNEKYFLKRLEVGDIAQLVECFLKIHEALGSIPSTSYGCAITHL